MLDLGLDDDFAVYLNGQNGIDTVTELEAFEQSVRVRITDYFYRNLLSETDPEIAKQKIRHQVHRVARDNQFLDEVKYIEISENLEKENSFKVYIEYRSDAISEFILINDSI